MDTRFEAYLIEVAARTINEGGTASKPADREFLPARDLWCFPKYPARTAILPPTTDLPKALWEFIQQNAEVLAEPDCWLGTWVNPQTGDFYLDVATGLKDLDEAISFAKQAGSAEGREVVAMFNPKRDQTVFL